MVWRPEDWRNPYIDFKKPPKHDEAEAFEAGAEAMLRILTTRESYHITQSGDPFWFYNKLGWLVFVPKEVKE